MKIPKSIQIAGKNITIVYDAKYCASQKCYGTALYDENKIILENCRHTKTSDEKIKQTFIHECIHIINCVLGENSSTRDDEKYVQSLSELLYQIIKQVEQ